MVVISFLWYVFFYISYNSMSWLHIKLSILFCYFIIIRTLNRKLLFILLKLFFKVFFYLYITIFTFKVKLDWHENILISMF